jgi:hypothetical protein
VASLVSGFDIKLRCKNSLVWIDFLGCYRPVYESS